MAAFAHRCVQTRIVLVALAILGASASASGLAATYTIDDTGTATADPTVGMRWQELSPRRRTSQLLTGATFVRVHLNLLPWVGRNARIFLVLPAQEPLGLTATWTTQGRLLPGSVTTGSRVLVYSGRIGTAVMEDTLRLNLTVNGTSLRHQTTLNFNFELEDE
jgi:hypothetical protein